MAAPMTPPTLLAKRYASALLDLAYGSNSVDALTKDLSSLEVMLSSSLELQQVVASPTISRANQGKAIAAVAEKSGFHSLSKQFLNVLATNRRMKALPDILKAVHAELSFRRGEITAHVSSAQALSDDQRSELIKKLSNSTGKKVSLRVTVDQTLIGGMMVSVGSKLIDDSVKTKLTRMRAALAGVANQN